MYLTRRTYLGLIGGGLIMIAVFLTGSGLNFDTKALNGTANLLLFVAGLGVAVFARLGRRTLAAYSAVAATTLALVMVIDLLRSSTLDLTAKLVILVLGVVFALMSSIGGDLMTYIAPTRDISTTRRTRTDATRTGASRTGSSRTGSSRTGSSRTGSTRTGSSRTGSSRTGTHSRG